MLSIFKNKNLLHAYIFLVLLSALRNISSLYYVVIILFTLYFFATRRPSFPKTGFHVNLFYLFTIFTLLMITWSGLYMQSLEFLPGIPRALLMIILTLILFMNIKYEDQVVDIIKVLLACYVVAALTIIYQIYFGQISWFVQSAGRAGLTRYPSILGSLTIYGSVVGYPLLILVSNLKIIRKSSVIVLMLLVVLGAGFFSLSKTGIMMIVISVILFFVADRKYAVAKIFNLKMFATAFLVMIVIAILFSNIQVLQSYYNASVTHTFGAKTIFADSSSVLVDSPKVSIDHIVKRLSNWVIGMINSYGNIVYFTGVGLQGGGGTMGLSAYPMAHNAFGDLFFMGGIPYLFVFLLLYIFTQYTHFMNRVNLTSKLFFMLNILFLVNMAIASGSVFQPSISAPFWLSVVYANIVNNKKRLSQREGAS
jgi:hypothetical protein